MNQTLSSLSSDSDINQDDAGNKTVSSPSPTMSNNNIQHPMAHLHRDTTYTKIFVGGLPYHTTDESLRNYFEYFGELEEAVVITDRQTGKSRGYGFVTMKNWEEAMIAVKDPNPCIDGRKTNVNLAILGAKPRNVPLITDTLASPGHIYGQLLLNSGMYNNAAASTTSLPLLSMLYNSAIPQTLPISPTMNHVASAAIATSPPAYNLIGHTNHHINSTNHHSVSATTTSPLQQQHNGFFYTGTTPAVAATVTNGYHNSNSAVIPTHQHTYPSSHPHTNSINIPNDPMTHQTQLINTINQHKLQHQHSQQINPLSFNISNLHTGAVTGNFVFKNNSIPSTPNLPIFQLQNGLTHSSLFPNKLQPFT